MRNALTIAGALLRAFRRSRSALFFTLLFPIALFLIIGSLTGRGAQSIDVGVIAGTGGANGAILRSLATTPGIELHVGDAATEKAALADQKRAILIDLTGVPADATLADPAKVPVAVSTARKGEAMAALVLIRQALAEPSIRTSPYDLAPTEDGSERLSYLVFLLPGMIGFSVMQMCVFSVAQGQLYARQSGMLKGLLLTRMTGLEFVFGTAVSRMLIALVQTTALILAALLVFKVHPVGNPFAILAILLLGGMVFVGLGFLISNTTSLQEAVNPTANAIMLPMFLLGGVFFPISSLPSWLQGVAHILPLTGFVSGLRQVITTGKLDATLFGNVALLAVWAVIILGAAAAMVRRKAWYTE